jgi:hypothetical protein
MTTLLISGSHVASDEMLAAARKGVMQAKENGWAIICGDSPGIDLQVINACEQLSVNDMCYGIEAFPRNAALKYTQLNVAD